MLPLGDNKEIIKRVIGERRKEEEGGIQPKWTTGAQNVTKCNIQNSRRFTMYFLHPDHLDDILGDDIKKNHKLPEAFWMSKIRGTQTFPVLKMVNFGNFICLLCVIQNSFFCLFWKILEIFLSCRPHFLENFWCLFSTFC